MYKVLLKGSSHNILLSNEEGEDLKRSLEDGSTEYVNLAGNYVHMKAIKAIVRDDEDVKTSDKMSANKEFYEKEAEKFRQHRAWLMELPLSERAREGLPFMRAIFFGVCGRQMTTEEGESAIKGATKWFTAHPDFHLPSPTSFIPKKEFSIASASMAKTEATPLKDLLKINALRLAERALLV